MPTVTRRRSRPASRDALLRELNSPVDLKKIDAGGGLIHGSAPISAATSRSESS